MKETVSDHLVHLYSDLRKAHKTASTKDIQDFSIRVYQASVRHEKRMAQLQSEQDRITRYNDMIWKQFISILDPLWKVEEKLFPLYDELKSIYADLDSLWHNSMRSPESVQMAQNRLNDFENKFRVDGRYILTSDQTSLAGQAVINGMLEECYKMTRKMIVQEPEIDQSLMELKEELDLALTELDMILSLSEKDKSIDLNQLESLQETLDAIDSKQKDSKFLDENGNTPKGQAAIRFLLEAAYDRVNDILLNLESSYKEGEYPESLKDLISNAQGKFSKETIMSKSKIEEVAKALSDSLLHPKETLELVSSKFLSLIRAGVSMLSKAYLQLEPISDELIPVSEKLNSIKTFLLKERNEFNKGITRGTKSSIQNDMIKFQSELDEIDRSRINGKFVNKTIQNGQYHVSSLLNECYCLLYELKHLMSD